MKKILLLLLLCIGVGCSEDNQSPVDDDQGPFPDKAFFGDVELNTQEDVNLFGQENYTVVTGNLKISSSTGPPVEVRITDLSSLLALKEVGGQLEVYGFMNNLEGLNNLERVEGGINGFLLGGPRLQNVDALSSLVFVGGGLLLWGNENLQNINGLSNLEVVSWLRFAEINFSDFSPLGMESVSRFTLRDSELTGPLTFPQGLTNIDFLEIERCPSLTKLDGLENISNINSLHILNNSSLTDYCGISNVLPVQSYYVDGNAYNPSQQDIIDGNCSL